MLGFFILSVGIGICLYYGMEWYELPRYTEAEIEQSTELNMQLDLQRMGDHLRPQTRDEMELMRAKLRAEITGSIKEQSDKVHLRFSVGLIAVVIGIGQLVSSWMLRRRFPSLR